jgi:probable rRNA maturation factor
MKMYFSNETKHHLAVYEGRYRKLFAKTLETLDLTKDYEMSVTLVSTRRIHLLNRTYRQVDRPTDVISFAYLDDKTEKLVPSKENPIDLGEIYICYDVARKNAKKYGNTLKRELCFLYIHGLLHLLGYNHMNEEDEKVMFGLQDVILPPKEVKSDGR